MSLIAYDLAYKKLSEKFRGDVFRLKILSFVVGVVLFLILRSGYERFSVVLLPIVMSIVGMFYFIFYKNLKHEFTTKIDDLYQNSFLVSLSSKFSLTYQPFGGFLIDDFGSMFASGANLCDCNRHMGGKFMEFEFKFGDLVLLRDFKKKKKFSLDKIIGARINDSEIFRGEAARFSGLDLPDDFKLVIKIKGEFVSELKMISDLEIGSEIFSVFTNDRNLALDILNGGLIVDLEKIMEILMNETSLYIENNILTIAIKNSQILATNTDKSLRNGVDKALEKVFEIAKNFTHHYLR